MIKKKYTYLLFFIAYIGALIIEKPGYPYGAMTVKECLSYLITVILHFALFALMITANRSLLIPYLLDKKLFGLYFLGLGGSVLLYTVFAGHYNGFLHNNIIHDRPIEVSGGF